jgi:hypothetical protein
MMNEKSKVNYLDITIKQVANGFVAQRPRNKVMIEDGISEHQRKADKTGRETRHEN